MMIRIIYLCAALAVSTVFDTFPQKPAAYASVFQAASTMASEPTTSTGAKEPANADSGKNSSSDTIVVKDNAPQISDSLENALHQEKNKALYGFFVMAAIGLFWAGVILIIAYPLSGLK